jgi:hypothetical protein
MKVTHLPPDLTRSGRLSCNVEPEVKPAPRYRFGPVEVDAAAGEIDKSGVKVRIPKKRFQILLTLL